MHLMRIDSIRGKRYVIVLVANLFRLATITFLRVKSKAFRHFKAIYSTIQNVKEYLVVRIKSDRGKEFHNIDFVLSMRVLELDMNSPLLDFFNKMK